MRLILIPAIIILSVAASCKQSTEHATSLSIEQLSPIDSCIIYAEPTDIWALRMSDNLALCYNSQQNNFIEVLSYPDFNLKYSYGISGQGPEEWVSHMYGSSTDKNEILLYDIMKSSLSVMTYNDSNLLSKDIISPLPVGDNGLVKPYGFIMKIGENIFLAKENNIEGSRLASIDLKANKVYSEYSPNLEIKGTDIKGYPIDEFHLDANSERILLAFENIDYLVLLALKDNEFHILKEIGDKSVIDLSQKKPQDLFALQVVEHNGNFYVLYSEGGESSGTKVRVFESNGEEKPTLILKHPAKLIAFDSDDKLIALSESTNNNIIYRYDLN